ncbi:MAG TPA: tripartite tricarboxylate transporter substrate binding protein [Burkholderiaceae bacterium]|jgi:tripartite-type tricarboxylate transporter receptor subunit TctC|nr:tripartite tricarboxylate transporter substrate binding protein [Burkholderiaceae bacterium]
MRHILTAALIGVANCAAVPSAVAQSADSYPSKVITIVVPTAPGGGNDAMARVVGQRLSDKLGKPVIVDNKPGANGSIAAEHVARAPADGHTLLWGYIATHGINPALQKLRYDPIKDFEPIGLVAESPTVLVVNTKAPFKTVPELLAAAKAKPGTINYASAGNGTAPHLAGEMFKIATGVDLVHVSYKGSSPGLMDTIGGTTQLMFPSLFTAMPHIQSGKLRAVAIAGKKRSPLLKEVPTLAEVGVKDVDVTQWYGLFAPAKTPKPIVERLNKELNAILAERDVIKKIGDQGGDVVTSSPAQLGSLVQTEVVRWKQLISAAKITAD